MSAEAMMYTVPMFYVWLGAALLWGFAIGFKIGTSIR